MTLIGLYSDTYSDTYAAGGSGGGVSGPRWNPNGPYVAGAEWFGANARPFPLSSALGRCARIVATKSENISSLVPFVLANQAGNSSQHVLITADVYDLDAPDPTWVYPQAWALAVPASNAAGGGAGVGIGHGWQIGTTTTPGVLTAYDATAWNRVNDVVASNVPLTTGATDFLGYSPATANPGAILFNAAASLYDGDTGLQNQSLTGKRVGWIEVVVVVRNDLPNGATVDGVITDTAGNRYTSDSGPISVAAGSGLKRLSFGFYWKPDTHLDWTAQSAANFLGTSRTFGVQVAAQPNAAATDVFKVTSVMCQFRVMTENRVAVGSQTVPITRAWQAIQMLDPLTRVASPWVKQAGHEYLVAFHLTNDGGGANLRVLDSANVVGHETDELTGITSAAVSFDVGGGVPIADPVNDIGAMSLILGTGSGASQDSQPYVTAAIYGVDTRTVSQLISKEAAGTFGAATILVQSQPDGQGGVLEDAPLNVSLRKTSDNTLLSGPATITGADVPPDGRWHAVTARLPGGAVLTPGEQVYLQLTTASTASWRTLAMLTRDISQLASDPESLQGAIVGIGSTDDYGIYAGVADLTSDFPFAIRQTPATLTGLTSAAGTIPNQPALDVLGEYRSTTIGVAQLAWLASSLGGQFAFYEIQTKIGNVWVSIGRVTDETKPYWNDVNPPKNVPVSYRVFVVGNPLGQSAISTFDPVTVPAGANDLIFTSEFAPDLSLAATDSDSSPFSRTYSKLPGTGSLTVRDMYGADKPRAFRQTEQGGDVFSRKLLVALDDPAVQDGTIPGDRALFDSLIALFHNPALPYVVVTDGLGRQWFAAAEATDAGTDQQQVSQIDVTFTEIDGPTILTTPTPWVP